MDEPKPVIRIQHCSGGLQQMPGVEEGVLCEHGNQFPGNADAVTLQCGCRWTRSGQQKNGDL